mmetsp:Transcript_3557/g.11107  ORF Transcript_3557/g.11107 Transcript_3557/m.11107 type:complete len:207 (+) Transcript_3557:335-955(+)
MAALSDTSTCTASRATSGDASSSAMTAASGRQTRSAQTSYRARAAWWHSCPRSRRRCSCYTKPTMSPSGGCRWHCWSASRTTAWWTFCTAGRAESCRWTCAAWSATIRWTPTRTWAASLTGTAYRCISYRVRAASPTSPPCWRPCRAPSCWCWRGTCRCSAVTSSRPTGATSSTSTTGCCPRSRAPRRTGRRTAQASRSSAPRRTS